MTETTKNRGCSVWILGLVALVVFGLYYWASPYITLIRAGQAIDARDTDAVCERIDFEALQDNVTADDIETDSSMVRGLLESGIRCETVDSMLGMADFFGQDEKELSDRIGSDARFGFETPIRFSMHVDQPGDAELRLVLSRTLRGWQLTDITWETT